MKKVMQISMEFNEIRKQINSKKKSMKLKLFFENMQEIERWNHTAYKGAEMR